MGSKFRNILVFFGIIALLLAAFAMWYRATYKMEEISAYSVNSEEMPNKIAIATQGSAFKEAVVTNVINQYKKDSVYINVFDISNLATLSFDQYDAIIIIHTWEYGNPPQEVSNFIEAHKAAKDKLIVFSTSGQGINKIEGIDALSGESILENASDYSDAIIEKVEKIIH